MFRSTTCVHTCSCRRTSSSETETTAAAEPPEPPPSSLAAAAAAAAATETDGRLNTRPHTEWSRGNAADARFSASAHSNTVGRRQTLADRVKFALAPPSPPPGPLGTCNVSESARLNANASAEMSAPSAKNGRMAGSKRSFSADFGACAAI